MQPFELSGQLDDENEFTICGFKSPQKIQWMNGKGKSMKLSDILSIIDMNEMPRIIEIAVSWDAGYQRTTILNIIKDIHHQYCSFNTELHDPHKLHYDTTSENEHDDDDDEFSMTYDGTEFSQYTNDEKNAEMFDEDLTKTVPLAMNLKLPSLNNVERNTSAPITYQQCMDRFNHIPIINDHIPKSSKSSKSSKQSSSKHKQRKGKTVTFKDEKKQNENNKNDNNVPSKLTLKQEKTLTKTGQCLALEELFSILCWKMCPKLSIKIQFADLVTIENCTNLILKYRNYFRLDSLSCIWYHGIFLHQFPMSSNRGLKKVFGSGQSNKLSFNDFVENIKKIPSLTYSLSWPTNNINSVKSPAPLKLCLSSILSEISIGNEHDIIIHFPIQYIYECYYIINDLITNKSYFPYVAFNFFNIHNNLHNFDFTSYYKLKYDQTNNGKNGYHHKNGKNQISIQKQQNQSGGGGGGWSLWGTKRNKFCFVLSFNILYMFYYTYIILFIYRKTKNGSQLPYDTNIADIRNLKEDQIVCKSDLNWLSSHIHQVFCFTSVSCVRFKNSPNDEFRKILGQHHVAEWSGRLSWNPKSNRSPQIRSSNLSPKGNRTKDRRKIPKRQPVNKIPIKKSNDINNNNEEKKTIEILKQPEINWDLWQLTRLDSKSRHFQSCIYNKNIGLAQRNGGWLISTRELRPPYRIKGRFFTADKHGILSIYIRCSSIEYPCNAELPSFGIGIHIGNEKLKIVTYRLQNKQITQQCGIGACIDNGYDFQIIDRGVMYPIVCQVERTGKDGKGDNFPQGKNLQIPYPRDSSQWMYHVMFVNSSNEWIIIDRLVVDEKNN